MTDTQSLEPPVPSTNGTSRRSYKPNPNLLGQEMMLEIGAHYEDRRITTEAIARAFGISNAMLSAVVDALGLARRGVGNTGSRPRGHFTAQDGKRVWVLDEAPPLGPPPTPDAASEARAQVVDEVPEPVEKALERMLRLPPRPEPVAHPRPQPTPVQVEDESLPVWKIDYLGSMLVRARDIDQALDRARQDGHLTQIVGVTLRSR
jgi:hypothetical protein